MNSRREQLSPFAVVLLLGAVVLVALVAAFQHDSYQDDYYDNEPASELTVSYLEAWLRVQPDSVPRLMLLGEQYLKLNRREQALALAGHMEQLDSADEETKRQALYLRVNVAQQRAYELDVQDERRPERMAVLRSELEQATAYAWAPARQVALSEMAWAAGAYDVALHFYRQLAGSDADNALDWHQRAAELAFARQEYEEAADSLFAAVDLSAELPQKRELFLRALQVLESGDRAALACELAEQHMTGLENDRQVIIYMLNLARMANRGDLIDKYARQLASLLELSSNEPVAPATGWLARTYSLPASAARALLAAPARWTHAAAGAVRSTDAYRGLQAGLRVAGWLSGRPFVAVANEQVAVAEPAMQPAETPVTDNDYDLLYQVYVESGSLTKARDIAKKALARGMPARIWEPRLAQVAEWGGEPGLALQAWSRHAGLTDSAESWSHVRRLSIGLNDDARYLQALQFDIRNTPNNAALYDELVLAYERLGEPERAMQFLQTQVSGSRSTVLLGRYAELAERAGHDQRAEELYHRLWQVDPASRAQHVTGVARLRYKQGKDESALQLMREQADSIAEAADTADYWRLYAELGRLLQSSEDTSRAYRSLLATGQATSADLAGMTYFFLNSPMDAARIAEMNLQQGIDPQRAVEAALLNYAELRAWSRVGEIMRGLSGAQRTGFQRSAAALMVKGRYHLYLHQWNEAVASFRDAVNAAPASDDARISYLWVLVEYGTEAELRQRLYQWRRLVRLNADYREVFAAAYLRLGQTARAIRLMRMQPPEVTKDPLWIMSLADAEQQGGHDELAQRLYRKAWRELHARLQGVNDVAGAPVPADVQLDWWQARGVLAQRLRNAEVTSRALNQLYVQDMRLSAPGVRYQSRLGDVSGMRTAAEVSDDVAEQGVSPYSLLAGIGVSLEQEANERARILLRHPAVRDLPASADYQMSLALAESDTTAAAELLDLRQGRIAYYSQVAALGANRRTSEQETLLFDGLDMTPGGDAIHEDLTQVIWPDKSALGVSMGLWRSEAISTHELDMFARLKLTNRYGITLHGITRQQKTRRKQDIAWVPSTDREYELSIHDRTVEHDFTLTLGQRDGFRSFATGRIFAEVNRHGTWVPSATLGWRQYTSLSPYLQVAGYKNMLDFALSWQPEDSRWFASANAEVARFYTQKHDAIARGTEFNQELGYRIYHAYPDWSVRLVAGQGNYSASGKNRTHSALTRMNPDGVAPANSELVPENFRRYGIMTGFGNNDVTTRKSSWKPFLDAGYIRDNKNGHGPAFSAGIGGPVLGGDHLVLQYLHEATGARNRQRTSQLLLSYYLNF